MPYHLNTTPIFTHKVVDVIPITQYVLLPIVYYNCSHVLTAVRARGREGGREGRSGRERVREREEYGEKRWRERRWGRWREGGRKGERWKSERGIEKERYIVMNVERDNNSK